MRRRAWLAAASWGAAALLAGCASPDLGSEAFGRTVSDAAGAARERAVYRSYHGKYTGDPRLAAGMDRVEAALPLAEDRVRRRLGVPALEFPPFSVCFVDGEGSGAVGSMETGLVNMGPGGVCVVAVVTEDLVTGLYDEERVLAHELTHVLHISGGAGAGAPSWLAEGIAHWVEFEDEESRKEFLLPSIAHEPRSKQVPLSELLKDEAALERRAEPEQDAAGAVVFFQLERGRGAEAVRRIVLRLLRERDWRAVLREETGRPLDGMFGDVRAGYLQWAPGAYPGFEQLNRWAEDDSAPTIDALDAFIAARAPGPVRTMAEFSRGHLLRFAGDLEGALEALRSFRRDHPRHFAARSTFLEEVGILRQRGDWNSVAGLCRMLLQDYLWSAAEAEVRKDIQGKLDEAVDRIRAGEQGTGAEPSAP